MKGERIMPKVTKIEPTKQLLHSVNLKEIRKKRVCAYARVSTDELEQLTSYEAQIDYYTKKIKSNPEWMFVKVYTDEGISGTSTKKREGFNQMIDDALNGKIDLILTKSISRFARNTVDTLESVRKLKEKGIAVYFEKENIDTLDSKGELMITIMSSLAQEESRSISENVTWGKRKSFADGKVYIPYKTFLGYEKGENGRPKINAEEAKIIRLIYSLYLNGYTENKIKDYLNKNHVTTAKVKNQWHTSRIKSILTNEKYAGNALLQKNYTVDFLTKKKKKNEGEVPQYFVKNSHPAIISETDFNKVQYEIEKRKQSHGYYTNTNIFSGKIICNDCGSFYGRKKYRTKGYQYIVYHCNHKYNNQCTSVTLQEEKIKAGFLLALNKMIFDKEKVIVETKQIIESVLNIDSLQEKRCNLSSQINDLQKKIEELNTVSIHNVLDRNKYEEEFLTLESQYLSLIKKEKEIHKEIKDKEVSYQSATKILEFIQNRKEFFKEFDNRLWIELLDKAIVRSDSLTFEFKNNFRCKVLLNEINA